MTYLTDCNCIKNPYLDSKVNLHSTTPSLFKRTVTNILKIKNSLLFTIIFVALGQVCWGQVNGDYVSIASTNWNLASTWGIYNGTSTPGAASTPPSFLNNVFIQTGHTINITGPATVLNLTIDGTLTLSDANIVLSINGNYANNGTFNYGLSTVIMKGSGTQSISGSGTLSFYNLTISKFSTSITSNNVTITDKDVTVNKTLTTIATCSLTWSGSATLTLKGNFSNTGTFYPGDGTVEINGTAGQSLSGGASQIVFNILKISNSSITGTSCTINLIVSTMIVDNGCIFKISSDKAVNPTTNPLSSIICDGTLQVTYDFLSQYNFATRTLNSASIVEFIGDGTQSQNISSFEYKNLIINNSLGCAIQTNVVVNCQTLTITIGVLTVRGGGILEVIGATNLNYVPTPAAACLILKSNESSTGSFKHSDTFNGSGTVMVERYMSNTNNWHLYSSPIRYTSSSKNSELSIHDFLLRNPEIPDLVDQLDGTVLRVGMREYATNLNDWTPYYDYNNSLDITKIEGGKMNGGKGFSICTIADGHVPGGDGSTLPGTGILFANGIPNPNSVNINLTKSTSSIDQGWNCIGNPFTRAIRVKDSNGMPGFLNSSNISQLDNSHIYDAVYVWDTNGAFGTNAIPEYVALNNSSTGDDFIYLQIGQGFFVKTHDGGGNVTFAEGMQISKPNLKFKSATSDVPIIKILVTNQKLSSTTQIKFISNTTKGLDPGYDAGMLKANPNFSLYSKLLVDNAADFTIQCLPDQNYDQYVIPIGIDCKVAGDITFTAETVNLPSGCQALLEDRLTKQFTRLDLKDAKYTAAVSADTKGTGRFFLHTSDVISGDQPIEKEPFKISKIGKTLYINGEVSDKANFYVYSINGKQLANFKAESQVQNEFDASGLPAGVYILTCDDQNQKKSTKFVIEN